MRTNGSGTASSPKRRQHARNYWAARLSPSLLRLVEPVVALSALAAVVTCARWGAPPQSATGNPNFAVATRSSTVPASSEVDVDVPAKPDENSAYSEARRVSLGNEQGKLISWSQALQAYRAGHRKEPMRVLWFGDSHTAADYWTNAVRKTIASEIPLAGPGYLALGIPNYRHGMARLWREGSMELSPHPPARRSVEDDGVFGLGGTRVTLKDSTAVISLKLTFESVSTTSINYELYYRTHTPADRLILTVGSMRKEFGKDGGGPSVGGLSTIRFEANGNNTVEIRALGGTPQLFGIVAETTSAGVVIDTLGSTGRGMERS